MEGGSIKIRAVVRLFLNCDVYGDFFQLLHEKDPFYFTQYSKSILSVQILGAMGRQTVYITSTQTS